MLNNRTTDPDSVASAVVTLVVATVPWLIVPDTEAANVPPAAINPAVCVNPPVLYSVRLPAAPIRPPDCTIPFVAVATPDASPAFNPLPIRRSPSDDSTPPDWLNEEGVTTRLAPAPVALIVPPDWANAPPPIDTDEPAPAPMIAPADTVTPPEPVRLTTAASTTPLDCTYVPAADTLSVCAAEIAAESFTSRPPPAATVALPTAAPNGPDTVRLPASLSDNAPP